MEKITQLETLILESRQNINELTKLKDLFLKKKDEKLKLASLHSLRRVFLHFHENNYFFKADINDNKLKHKLEQFRAWLLQQYNSYKNELYNLSISNNPDLQVPSIRTIIELTKYENHNVESRNLFKMNTFSNFIQKIITGGAIDIDILLLLKDEVFIKLDCSYYTLLAVLKCISNYKIQNKSKLGNESDDHIQFVQNLLDILRVIPTPNKDSTIDKNEFLILDHENDSDDENSDNDSDDSDDDSDNEKEKSKFSSKNQTTNKRKNDQIDSSKGIDKKRRRKIYNRQEQLEDSNSHVKIFSKCWIKFFSLKLSTKQIKLALKYLQEYLIPVLHQPFLLADYLANIVTFGYNSSDNDSNNNSNNDNSTTSQPIRQGVIQLLALESLFDLILRYNLDYPNYFECLYSLLNVEIMSAKYRGKFMNLLHVSLKSTNIPSYSIAAFIKRLSVLSLTIPGPAAIFCLAQIVWLLRRHPQCLVLIHRTDTDTTPPVLLPLEQHLFDLSLPLETCNALQTSLFEIPLLQQHYIQELSELAKEIETNYNTTTSVPTQQTPLNVEKYMTYNYKDMIKDELKKNKKFHALAYQEPKDGVFIRRGFIGKLFGIDDSKSS